MTWKSQCHFLCGLELGAWLLGLQPGPVLREGRSRQPGAGSSEQGRQPHAPGSPVPHSLANTQRHDFACTAARSHTAQLACPSKQRLHQRLALVPRPQPPGQNLRLTPHSIWGRSASCKRVPRSALLPAQSNSDPCGSVLAPTHSPTNHSRFGHRHRGAATPAAQALKEVACQSPVL